MFLQFYRVVFQDSVLWVTADFEISQISSEDNNGQISFFVRISFLRDFTLELVFISQKQKKESKFCSFKFDPVFSVQLSRFSWFFAITTSQVQKNQKNEKDNSENSKLSLSLVGFLIIKITLEIKEEAPCVLDSTLSDFTNIQKRC